MPQITAWFLLGFALGLLSGIILLAPYMEEKDSKHGRPKEGS